MISFSQESTSSVDASFSTLIDVFLALNLKGGQIPIPALGDLTQILTTRHHYIFLEYLMKCRQCGSATAVLDLATLPVYLGVVSKVRYL